MIAELITKKDNYEIIRDQVAAILATESAHQQVLARKADKDPDDWKLRVFIEKALPFEEWLGSEVAEDTSPIVNVWFDNTNFETRGSNIVERQKATSIFNVDCYGYGASADNPLGGHNPGDTEAAFSVQRALRFCRNILMASEYTYLGLRGLVWQRWPQGITVFQPELNGVYVQRVAGARFAFSVVYNEMAPQYEGCPIEAISIDVLRSETGELLVEADYDYS